MATNGWAQRQWRNWQDAIVIVAPLLKKHCWPMQRSRCPLEPELGGVLGRSEYRRVIGGQFFPHLVDKNHHQRSNCHGPVENFPVQVGKKIEGRISGGVGNASNQDTPLAAVKQPANDHRGWEEFQVSLCPILWGKDGSPFSHP